MPGLTSAVIAAMVFLPMLIEARRASANERAQLARGGVEPAGDVYRMMEVAYPAVFLAMIAEGAIRGGPALFEVGLVLFASAKMLKWWAIVSLGPSWTFRLIVVPGAPLVASGPYAYLRHPNYVAVAAELVAVALMTGAMIAGPIGTAGFAVLMWKRIGVESRALRQQALP
jgi:methyltransferase